jgi:hypothetical protein
MSLRAIILPSQLLCSHDITFEDDEALFVVVVAQSIACIPDVIK